MKKVFVPLLIAMALLVALAQGDAYGTGGREVSDFRGNGAASEVPFAYVPDVVRDAAEYDLLGGLETDGVSGAVEEDEPLDCVMC